MSKPGLSFGFGLKKSSASKPAPAKRKPTTFGGDDDSDEEPPQRKGAGGTEAKFEVITEIDGFEVAAAPAVPEESSKKKNGSKVPLEPPKLSSKGSKSSDLADRFGDLSSSLSSRKYASEAAALDPSIYDYDEVYDSIKPQKQATKEDVDRRPKYMNSLMSAATVRERERQIAEDRRLAREREAEGDEFEDKEQFVTEAYKRQMEENKRLEEEEKRKEEEDKKKNKNRGMAGFYKEMLDREEQAHAEKMKAAEEARKTGSGKPKPSDEPKEKTEAELAQEILAKGGKITVNEDGQIVDKRQLLKGGLNVGAKKQAEVNREKTRLAAESSRQGQASRGVYAAGGKNAMRERQSRMIEAQLEESLKRAREEEDEERKKVEVSSKSRKTEADISSAKERYLARKKAAEEAKKAGLDEVP
jgi:hypothetical protein